MIVFFKALKNILQSNKFYVIVALLAVFYMIIFFILPLQSKYSEDDLLFKVTVTKIRYKNDQVIIEFMGREKLISYYEGDFNYQIGDKLVINGYLTKPSQNTIPNLFDYRHYLEQNGIFYLLNIENITLKEENHNIIYKLKNKIITRINNINQNKDYLYAFILGENYYLEKEIKDSYQYNGVSHLFAIGSMHISIMTLLLGFIFTKLKINDYIMLIIMIIFMGIYVILTDYAVSIMRCAISFIFVFFNKKWKCKIKYQNIILLVACFNIFYSPSIIYNLGFQYSYLISYVLTRYSCLIKGNYLKKLVIISFLALLVSIPITIYNNYEINFMSIILNLFFVPVINFIVCPLCFLVLLIPSFNNILSIVITIVENLTRWFSNVKFMSLILAKPSWYVIISYYAIIIYILQGFRKGKYKPIILLFIVLFFHNNINFFLRKDFMTILDVKQGDAILLHSQNQTVLIDTGGSYYNDYSDKIISYLKSIGIKRINYMFITHGDFDHIGSSYSLVNNFNVDNVYFNSNEYNDNEVKLINILENKNICYERIKRLTKLKIGQIDMYNFSYNLVNENDASIVSLIKVYNRVVMLMGDASKITEEYLLSDYTLPEVDILKVGHHGSNTSTSWELLNKIKPKYSLISVGKNNLYHHPARLVIDRLSDTKIWQTSINGSIYIDFKNFGTFTTYAP